jgi:hypothetical protein
MIQKYLMGLNLVVEIPFFHLAELDAQILVNHSKLNELHERIVRIRFPVQQKLDEATEEK